MEALRWRPIDIPLATACRALGMSRATLYRTRRPRPMRVPRPRPPSPRRLSDEERAAVLDTLTSDAFCDQPPAEVYAALLSQGRYLASIRTMYRILHERFAKVPDRREQRAPRNLTAPSLEAIAPNQVWTWDITKLAGPERGSFFCLYVIVDFFSRFVVGWMVAQRESAALAQQLFADACARHDVVPGSLIVHADRGGPMRSDGLAQLFASLGVERSFSRSRVSDDNPFIESHFKTLKYQAGLPRSLRQSAPRAGVAAALLRVVAGASPSLRSRTLHPGRRLPRPRPCHRHRSPSSARCRLRRASAALPARRTDSRSAPSRVAINPTAARVLDVISPQGFAS